MLKNRDGVFENRKERGTASPQTFKTLPRRNCPLIIVRLSLVPIRRDYAKQSIDGLRVRGMIRYSGLRNVLREQVRDMAKVRSSRDIYSFPSTTCCVDDVVFRPSFGSPLYLSDAKIPASEPSSRRPSSSYSCARSDRYPEISLNVFSTALNQRQGEMVRERRVAHLDE